jgi:cold shock CspA family protein
METTHLGLIHRFKQENGFGTLELEDGREVRFDVTACVEEPLEGQAVRVVLGTGRTGEPRAILVEPKGVPDSTRPTTTLREALHRLHVEGLALELDDYELGKIARELGMVALTPTELLPVLALYYADSFVGARRSQTDLFIAWQGGERPTDFEKRLAQLLGGESVTFDSNEVNVHSLDDVVDAFNEELRASGDTRRIIPLHRTGQPGAYYCMALARAVRLSLLGVLRVRWDRPHLTPSEPPPRNA